MLKNEDRSQEKNEGFYTEVVSNMGRGRPQRVTLWHPSTWPCVLRLQRQCSRYEGNEPHHQVHNPLITWGKSKKCLSQKIVWIGVCKQRQMGQISHSHELTMVFTISNGHKTNEWTNKWQQPRICYTEPMWPTKPKTVTV